MPKNRFYKPPIAVCYPIIAETNQGKKEVRKTDTMLENSYEAENILELKDSCYGEVTCRTQKGIFILLENGTECFSFTCASLASGSKVLCSVLRQPMENRKTLVSVDSVMEYAA